MGVDPHLISCAMMGKINWKSGCGAAWLARLLGVQEVPSSNLGSPTKFPKELLGFAMPRSSRVLHLARQGSQQTPDPRPESPCYFSLFRSCLAGDSGSILSAVWYSEMASDFRFCFSNTRPRRQCASAIPGMLGSGSCPRYFRIYCSARVSSWFMERQLAADR